LKCEANYIDGNQHGLTSWWYDNGQISNKVKYNNGKENGIYKSWHQNGKIATIQKWRLGISMNKKNWDEKGNIIKEEVPPPPPVNLIYPD
jgi:antitoxin component YwqK of YwqJK toxin-antitoxin module